MKEDASDFTRLFHQSKSKFLDELGKILYSGVYSRPNRACHEGNLPPMLAAR
jgi:hypothetical protein